MENGEDFWTRKNRVTRVTRTEILECDTSRETSIGRYEAEQANGRAWLKQAVQRGDPVWQLRVYTRTGFDAEISSYSLHASRAEAEDKRSEYPLGSEVDILDFIRPNDKTFDPENLSVETLISVLGRGEPPYELIYDAFHGAGLYEDSKLSTKVTAWLGPAGQKALEQEYGESWECVAILEYCVKHYDPTSLVTLAARAYVGDFIADGDYDCGYASRELKMLYGGAEQAALRHQATTKKAGAGGAKVSAARKLERLEALMQEIERLSGAVGFFSEDRILDQAFEAVREREPNFPKTKKTLDEYGTALRSEEPFKCRYEAVFRKNA